jgi:hypothetical protein
MKSISETIGKAIDQALKEAKSPPAPENKFNPHVPGATPVMLRQVREGIPGEVITTEELATLRKFEKRWTAAYDLVMAHVYEQAKQAFNRQNEALLKAILDEKPLPPVSEIQSLEDFAEDFETIREAGKRAYRCIGEMAAPVARKVFARYAGLVEKKMAVLRRQEEGTAAAVGLEWSPSADYVALNAVCHHCKRNADPEGNSMTGGRPKDMLNGVVEL